MYSASTGITGGEVTGLLIAVVSVMLAVTTGITAGEVTGLLIALVLVTDIAETFIL